MSLELFMKQNVIQPEEVSYVASDRFQKEDGEAAEWVLKPIQASQYEEIRNKCFQITMDSNGEQMPKVDTKTMNNKVAVACTVYPNLNDKSLQDSYGVMCAEELLFKMLLPGEYDKYVEKALKICGFGRSMDKLVKQVKNS